MSLFLSPATNRRRDRYGGALENRARLACEVVRRVRITVGGNFPVLIKLNSEDFRADGFQQGEGHARRPL